MDHNRVNSRKNKNSNNWDRALYSHQYKRSIIAEQYRTLRTNIQFTSMKKNIQSLLISSPGVGEGKTTTTINLAIVLAQQGKKVLLIDGDLRRPVIHDVFQINNDVGLSTVLIGRISADSAVKKVVVPNLYVLPSGPVPPNPSELLTSEPTEQLIKEATDRYDFVLVDSPPTLAVADAQILANICDGSILVIKSGKTTREASLKAIDIFKQSSSKFMGVSINGNTSRKQLVNYNHS